MEELNKKREEIREGLENHLYTLVGMTRFRERETDPENIEQCLGLLLEYLQTVGCVLKVESDLAYTRILMDKVPLSGNTAYVETREIEKAGYVAVEPLIKEEV